MQSLVERTGEAPGIVGIAQTGTRTTDVDRCWQTDGVVCRGLTFLKRSTTLPVNSKQSNRNWDSGRRSVFKECAGRLLAGQLGFLLRI